VQDSCNKPSGSDDARADRDADSQRPDRPWRVPACDRIAHTSHLATGAFKPRWP
jgi:hypothetical protein